MKKKFVITFTADTHYSYVDTDKLAENLSKSFEQWLKDWTASSGENIMPVLYESHRDGAVEHSPSGTVRVKVKVDNKIILDTWWDELSGDF